MTVGPTATQRENMALAQRALQLYVGRDIEGLLQLYHPDVVVTAPDFMNAGPFRGHDGFMEWISRWNEAWETFDFDIKTIEPVGEHHVVLSILVTGRGAGSRVEVNQMSYWVAEIRDKLGTYIEVVLSEERAFELARRREAETGP